MAVAEEPNGTNSMVLIDETYEFSAPQFFDFTREESDEDSRKAELWFRSALAYAPSPFMPRIRTGRSFKVETMCDFSEADQVQKVTETSELPATTQSSSKSDESQSEVKPPTELKVEEANSCDANKENDATLATAACSAGKDDSHEDKKDVSGEDKKNACATEEAIEIRNTSSMKAKSGSKEKLKTDAFCTPKPPMPSRKGGILTESKKLQSARHIASLVRNPSALKTNNQSQSSLVRGGKKPNVKDAAGTPNLAQENQAIKRQKLEGGRTRQILNVKPPQPLLHKSKPGLGGGSSSFCLSTATNMKKEERKIYVREQATSAPFVSMAEMMKKFQSNTRDLSLPSNNGSLAHDDAASALQRKPKLTLTRPKEPEFETSQRVRSVKIKSTAELEEEMMAKIPKFKARPLNKKILEAPTLPALPRSTPQLPEFQEFHLETTARANLNSESASVASTEVFHQSNQWKPHLTEPESPVLHTSLRFRPPTVKSSYELEKEEMEKMPKFKARPLNKKIFESKGELGMFCNAKKQITIPQEFHFATDERIPPPAAVADLFDKLSINSESHHENALPRNTTPNPFRLHTEERGAEKERRLAIELMEKKLEEEKARVPRANPYPYTTDYPVVPPKPDCKPCTRPEPFQLESLVRHEEEKQRELEERQRLEKEEAERRKFKAQPVLKDDPIPLPNKVRKPLTQVQQFNLHVDHRAVDRAEFDQKVKEKEQQYKRYREESEAARMLEEEKALKQMRREMVPHARPVPNFAHPFCPQKSGKETTKAKSPKLRLLQRRMERQLLMKAVSSPASSMR
ncbi:hypothetical protein Tsubulata_042082 [Turnera subulata]|uniref:TPX2 C-terminal domain-containing protein n=1 Tax=Turnera subulata TaxID=218843 RepID=A0A9Q0GKM9_9ROSI|nr:hypothetical protein Tsubulata_042082 [Turnera subulata]